MKKIAILGSTGSIGTQTLEVVRENGDIEVLGLAAGSNIKMLEEQIREFHPQIVAVWSEEKAEELRVNVADTDTQIVAGMDGLLEVATMNDTEILVTAVVGMIGIRPTIEAIKAGKDIALANKETLVVAGELINQLAQQYRTPILPVDSEHSAVFQCLAGEVGNPIEKVILTASGGPFRTCTLEQLKSVTKTQALKHPNWEMGAKITIDSASMMNKGFEVIEAKWLFGVQPGQIEVVVHPQSVIHSMVQFVDGGIMAQLGSPDMRLPIQYALYYPERRPLNTGRVDFFELGKITFEKPDFENFRGLKLAYEAASQGGNIPTAFNAANEVAVRKFLNREIAYLDIPEMIAYAMEQTAFKENPDVAQILETERAVTELLESRW